ncbi:hypothetical protein NPIL_495651 [Nephila pilipes]|uniref:Uncharacterized protein n=1 Tax=Nephila pilipes TaxID=299642 RepID=A0A8X6NZR2_NEPPI|nr:hypothetical protein NPIL_495651 [Nephila pilipes]
MSHALPSQQNKRLVSIFIESLHCAIKTRIFCWIVLFPRGRLRVTSRGSRIPAHEKNAKLWTENLHHNKPKQSLQTKTQLAILLIRESILLLNLLRLRAFIIATGTVKLLGNHDITFKGAIGENVYPCVVATEQITLPLQPPLSRNWTSQCCPTHRTRFI